MKNNPYIHRAYLAAIAIKGFDGAIETLVGLAIWIAGTQRIYATILRLTAPELEDERRHAIIHAIRHGASGLAETSTVFIVTYLLVHGILKLGLAVALLRGGHRWIYPVACLILSSFIAFMCYHLAQRWSNWVLGFALFDFFTMALVVNEWIAPQKAR